jgi:hypothetical protein
LQEIALQCDRVLKAQRRRLVEVDPDDPPARADDAGRDLHPATRPAAEIGDAISAAQQAMLSLQLLELVRRPRAEPFALRALVEGVFAVVRDGS